ncbi:MAG: O-antigen ligase family protein [Planctomycetota bacterium]
MSGGVALALLLAALAYFASGARRLAYCGYYLAYVPFITIDASMGGLTDVTQLGGSNLLFKLSVRVAATALVLWSAWRERERVLRVLSSAATVPLIVLVLWALLGLYRTQVPWVPLFRLGELCVFFVTGATLFAVAAHDAPPRAILRWHCLALAPLLAIAVWFAMNQPELAFHTSRDGIQRMGHKFMNANVLGFSAVVVLLWSAFELSQPRERARAFLLERALPWLTLSLAAYVLYHARSRTATVTAFVGFGVLFFPYWPSERGRAARFALGLAALALVAALSVDSFEQYFLRGESAAEVATGTGRTELWKDLLLQQVPRAPWLGAGYMMLSSEGGFFHAGHFWNNAHNTYLFALVSLGVPGFLCVTTLALMPLVVALRRLYRAPRAERGAWTLVVALLVVVVLTSIPEFGIVGYPNVTMLFHYALYAFVMLRGGSAPRELQGERHVSRAPNERAPSSSTLSPEYS